MFGESKCEKLTGSNLLLLEPVGFAKPLPPATFVESLYNVKYPVAALYVVVLTSIIILELVEDGVIDTARGTLTQPEEVVCNRKPPFAVFVLVALTT